MGQHIRDSGPEGHHSKAGTPTMGGILILGAILGSLALWGNYNNSYFIIVMVATILLGGLGFIDDYIKSVKRKKDGLPARVKC